MDHYLLLDSFVSGGIGRWLFKILLNGLAIMSAAYLMQGVKVTDLARALIASFVLALLNSTLGAVLDTLTYPVRFVTLGLFSLVVDAAVIMVASYFLKGFEVRNFGTAFWLAVLLAVFNTVLHWIYL
ncbi:MAG: phage holin family protein [Lewinellaceae bacterium]|nr:phage holin family protein [Lewinella sp.]MCB9280336.1 phage holin family protein [Lewinellaceae bacterium]